MKKKHFGDLQTIQQRSLEYLSDNEKTVREHNQKTLCAMMTMYSVVLMAYNVIVPIFFSDWNVNYIYQIALMIQVPVFILILIRYAHKERSTHEVSMACGLAQIYVMTFIIIVSVMPPEMEQPAVYFAPLVVAFVMSFTFSYRTNILLVVAEVIALNVVSFNVKSSSIFNVNLYSSLLLLLITVYISRELYKSRFSENDARRELENVNKKDKLTQVYSRAATEELCQQYITEHPNGGYALMIIDADNFKNINDSFGHQTGDDVLTELAQVLQEAVGNRNVVGRIGGDEFMIFIKHWDERQELIDIASQAVRNANKIKIANPNYLISCSIGIHALPVGESMDYENLFLCADTALYRVKKRSKNAFEFYLGEAKPLT